MHPNDLILRELDHEIITNKVICKFLSLRFIIDGCSSRASWLSSFICYTDIASESQATEKHLIPQFPLFPNIVKYLAISEMWWRIMKRSDLCVGVLAVTRYLCQLVALK